MADITLLDGAIGQELVHMNGKTPTPLWSTQILIDNPTLVADLHEIYFKAGASVATTNSYAVHRSRLKRENMEHRLEELLFESAFQARKGLERAGCSGRVAASLGPLMASYRPDLEPDADIAETLYREMATALVDDSDFFLIETVSSIKEAEGALRGTKGFDKPVWIAFSVMDDDGARLRSGEQLTDIHATIETHDPAAILINCARPESIPAALDILAGFGKPFGAYANGFEKIEDAFLEDAPTVDVLTQRRDLGPEAYAAHAMAWVDQGATIVGGCCEVGPAHIAQIAKELIEAGHKIV